MRDTLVGLALTAVAMAFYAAGEAFSKKYADLGHWVPGLLAVLAYTVTSALWLPVLRLRNQLAVMSALWTVFYVLLGAAVGVGLFGEHLSRTNMVGIALAVASVVFLCL